MNDTVYGLRRLNLNSTANTRDIGGHPTREGKVTQFGRFLRSDVPTSLTKENLQLLLDMEITTVIDLRSEEEADRLHCHMRGDSRFNYRNVPINPEDITFPDATSFARGYFEITTMKEKIHTIFTTIANAPGGCFYHCTAGKDRTGITSALLLMLAQVEDMDIIADYSITTVYLYEFMAKVQKDNPDLPAYVMHSKAENMREFLAMFYEAYGSIEQYFKSIGLTDAEMESIRTKLLVN